MKKKPKKLRSSMVREIELTAQLLEKTGYTKLKTKHKDSKVLVRSIPIYGEDIEHREKYPSLGGFAKTPGKKQLPPDAKQFPVGNSHKQGLELIYSKEYASQMNGKKT